MFSKMSVVNKLAFVAVICVVLGFGLVSVIVSQQVYSSFKEQSYDSLRVNAKLAVNSFESFNNSSKQAADKMANVFTELAGSIKVNEAKSLKAGEFDAPEVTSDGKVQNGDFAIVDKFTRFTNGSVATIFARKGSDFIRITTSLKKEDGTRAFGTKLDTKHPAYAKALAGEQFLGKATLFGKQYITKYTPIKQDGKVVAILFVGFDITEQYKALVDKVRELKIGETGYYYALDASASDKVGTLIIHPKLEGKSIYDTPDADGEKFVHKIIEKKDGEIEYKWKDDTGVKEKVAIFTYFKDWNMILVAGAMKSDIVAPANKIQVMVLVTGAIVSIVCGIVLIFFVRSQLGALTVIQTGLQSFFRFLSNESGRAEQIKLNSADEFGQMAKSINENISKIEKGVIQDNAFIANVKNLASEMKQGHFLAKVEQNASNPALQELKTIFNDVQETIEHKVARDLNLIFAVLASYGKQDFTARIPNAYGEVAVAINKLGDEISMMLKENLENGYELLSNSSQLTQMVEQLSTSSNQQAASLEETAASLEEITSVIRETSMKSTKMAGISAETKKSAEHSMTLTTRTVKNMDEIDKATSAINEAVSIIENISFQTNILSLNAAVEAATAGEAGKGFAVVAQEVRNLANRSAEAAKNIKELAQEANDKTAEGRQASSDMMAGLTELREKIEETTRLVQDVTTASREQMSGVEQINDAVTQLDQMTQENASVSSQTSVIAENVSRMANELVENAGKKKFIGKESVARDESKMLAN
jgi:methyl-accepting chemotaxis protein